MFHFVSRDRMRRQGTSRGLLLRNNVWHIDKVLFGKRLCESTRSSDLKEAEALLAHRTTQARRVHLYGEPAEHTFREAGVKFLRENQHKRSIERDVRALKALDPFIGSLPLARIHQGTLEPFIRWRLGKGSVGGTINRELAVVKRILNLASRYWRDDADQPWMLVAPMLPRLRQLHQRQSYPLSVAEQRLLFSELDGHLRTMALFKVNTGLRQAEVVNLRWEWEVEIPELQTSIFVIPREYTKFELDRYVVLNRIARSVIESCRGRHSERVFTYKGSPITKMYNAGWKAARRRASLRYVHEFKRPCPSGFRAVRVHDLKHTFGHRLRAVGVSFEDRKVLLGHKTFDVTTHYSAAEIGFLMAATERVCDLAERASPAIAVVHSSTGHAVRAPCPRMAPASQACEPDSPSGLSSVATPVANNPTNERDEQVLPGSVKNAAEELAKAAGISLDQFIANAVAAAVAEKVGLMRTSQVGLVPDSPLVAAVRRPYGPIAMGSGKEVEAIQGGLAKGDLDEALFWRRPAVTPPNVRRAAIIKKRSAKFPMVT
jgi:integrase